MPLQGKKLLVIKNKVYYILLSISVCYSIICILTFQFFLCLCINKYPFYRSMGDMVDNCSHMALYRTFLIMAI